MEHFDFIVFESYKSAENHWFDVELISRMLQSQGKKVAVFDLYNRYKDNSLDKIPIIHWEPNSTIPDDSWMKRKHSLWDTFRYSTKYTLQEGKYLKEAKAFIKDKADNFYCGSYHVGMSTTFFDVQKPCYWWGLRSERFQTDWKKTLKSPLKSFKIRRQRRLFLRNPYQRLFVSNEIILKEHEVLGISRGRMLVREERCVETIGNAAISALTKDTSFLVIGMLRPGKHVTTTIEAFKRTNIEGTSLSLVGSSMAGYENQIISSIGKDNRIFRTNKYLEYDDFYREFQKSHFVLFADEQGPCCITNGTMLEALIHHRPIICPNYNPYRYYIEKYHVGILYKPNDIVSYAEALQKAVVLGMQAFIPAIEDFLQTILFDRVAKEFVERLNKMNDEI